jgi:hypothetical protein
MRGALVLASGLCGVRKHRRMPYDVDSIREAGSLTGAMVPFHVNPFGK